MPTLPRIRFPKQCQHCGAAYEVTACDLETSKYCSHPCYTSAVADGWKQRFLSRLIKQDGCWGWSGAFTTAGYCRLRSRGADLLGHRLSWEHHKGTIPEGLWVLHKCDNPGCCNPDHLFLGTPKDNVHDMISKNRKVVTRGEQSGNAKLTVNEVVEIRNLRRSGMTTRGIANRFGVGPSSISLIARNKRWSHIAC